jgi:CBS domain containing-hemolysin-like protein
VWLFDEPLQPARLTSFALIWLACCCFPAACGTNRGIGIIGVPPAPPRHAGKHLIILLPDRHERLFRPVRIALVRAPAEAGTAAAEGDARRRSGAGAAAPARPFLHDDPDRLNALAILAGILGEGAYAPWFAAALAPWLAADTAATLASLLSFLIVTSTFILFADLLPKRIAIVAPEAIALRIAAPMALCIRLLAPLIWAFNGIANRVMARCGLPERRPEDVTPEDIVALAQAGAEAGVVAEQEQQMIENVFELEARTAPSTMTVRDGIVWLDRHAGDADLRAKLAAHPHAKFPVCAGSIDEVIGYVDSKDILSRC